MLSLRPLLVIALLSAMQAPATVAAEKAAAEKKVVKYCRFQAGSTTAYGIVEGDRVRELSGNLFGKWQKTDKTHALRDVTLLVPSAHPTKVMAMAGNYKDHLGDTPPPSHPELFFKAPSCLLRHEGEIVQPQSHAPVHYEAELVIVIGRRAKRVQTAKALDYVLGVTCGNDVSARDWQQNDIQWWRAKGSDTFGPCGPFIVSGIDYNNLNIELRVNGEVRQKTNTKTMVHNVAETVSFISQHITLEPGDLVFTGTMGQTQPLNLGDEVEVEIEGVGILRNTVVSRRLN